MIVSKPTASRYLNPCQIVKNPRNSSPLDVAST